MITAWPADDGLHRASSAAPQESNAFLSVQTRSMLEREFWDKHRNPARSPNTLDGTFGPQVVFVKAPPPGRSNLSPYSGLQFFGEVNIDSRTTEMVVDLRDINGVSVFSRTLQPR